MTPPGSATHTAPIRILTFTSLYPNERQPRHGIFVENRLRELRNSYPVDITVVAPVPWFPLTSPRFGRYANLAQVPAFEEREGVPVHHPRYLVLPKVGMSLAPLLMWLSVRRFIAQLHQERSFDLIDGHFFYPDGVVASRLGQALGLPVLNTARGNDITLYRQYALPRRQLAWAVENCSATISVCRFLAEGIESLGTRQRANHVMRNGVDLEMFREQDRDGMRRHLQLDAFTLLSVGGLIERKGHGLIIEAMLQLPDCRLLIIGDGPLEHSLKAAIEENGLRERVTLLGLVPHHALPGYYSAADCLVLASSSEGWANVLLESMACGTPVVATAVSGTPEVVQSSDAGVLIEERSPAAIAKGVNTLRQHYPDRSSVRRYAEQFSWQDTSDALYALMSELVGRPLEQAGA